MLKKVIKSDLYRYNGKSGFKDLVKTFVTNPGFRYSTVLRISSLKKKSLIGFVNKLYMNRLQYKFGFQISHKTQIGEGLYIGHFGQIIINPKAILGKNINIAPGVVIGQENRGKKQGTPVICDKVWIGSNAIITGKITIGSNVLIAPGAYVNMDVPENSIVFGNPGIIKHNTQATENYINNCID
jgi:serine O-acetyltransferase